MIAPENHRLLSRSDPDQESSFPTILLFFTFQQFQISRFLGAFEPWRITTYNRLDMCNDDCKYDDDSVDQDDDYVKQRLRSDPNQHPPNILEERRAEFVDPLVEFDNENE